MSTREDLDKNLDSVLEVRERETSTFSKRRVERVGRILVRQLSSVGIIKFGALWILGNWTLDIFE